MKPLGTTQVEAFGRMVDEDCVFVHRLLRVSPPLDRCCPDIVIPEAEGRPPPAPGPSKLEQVEEMYLLLRAASDLVIILSW